MRSRRWRAGARKQMGRGERDARTLHKRWREARALALLEERVFASDVGWHVDPLRGP